MKYFLMSLLLVNLFVSFALAKDDHDHDHEHEHSETETEEAEANASVGPDKGITEVNEQQGFKLSPEALKNFELKVLKLTGKGPWNVPNSAILNSGEEMNIFRVRNGFFKRINFQTFKKIESELSVNSKDLREGDEIVIGGLGFLRIAELAASGGVSHGHSH